LKVLFDFFAFFIILIEAILLLSMHESYETKLGHKADFKVHYKFRSFEEGGRKNLPFQGIHSDFTYEDDDDERQYIIHPEFLDAKGNLILDNTQPVPAEGTALMWIILPEKRKIHKNKLKVGTRGFFREGSLYTADCEVIEIIGLPNNPTTS
jgi:hypothetical protein